MSGVAGFFMNNSVVFIRFTVDASSDTVSIVPPDINIKVIDILVFLGLHRKYNLRVPFINFLKVG